MTTIRNRRRVGRGQEVGPNELLELIYGPGGDFRTRCDRCRSDEIARTDNYRHESVGPIAFVVNEAATRGTPQDGFHDDDTPCLSYFASPDDRQAAWEHLRAEPHFRRRQFDKPPWAQRVYG